MGFFGKLGGSHCEDRKSVAFFSIRALLNAHSVHSLKGSVTGCVNGLPKERRFFGVWAKKHLLIRVLVERDKSRGMFARDVVPQP